MTEGLACEEEEVVSFTSTVVWAVGASVELNTTSGFFVGVVVSSMGFAVAVVELTSVLVASVVASFNAFVKGRSAPPSAASITQQVVCQKSVRVQMSSYGRSVFFPSTLDRLV